LLRNFLALHGSNDRPQDNLEDLMGRLFSTSGGTISSLSISVGQTAYICVYADRLWNDSGINVNWRETYNFTVPNGENWINWRKKCGADGYSSTFLIRPWESLRRIPEANWFSLIGAIGKSTRPSIAIGSQLIGFSPPYPGRLYFFANDLPWMYWNNKGVIAVRVTRTI
jgi:hypothetical protein